MTELRLCKDCKWYKKDWFEHLTGGVKRLYDFRFRETEND